MKITIIASGSRGDVQPYIALGKGLHDAGYGVNILTSDDFEPLVTEASLTFRSIGTSIEAIIQTDEWRRTTESGNFLAILRRMNQEMKKYSQSMAEILPNLLADADVLLAGTSMMGSFAIAEKMDIPAIQAYVFPITPTRAFSSPLTPALPLGGLLNPLSFHMMRQVLWQSVRVSDTTLRKELGMPRGSFWGPFRALERQNVPVLYGYSAHVLPRPDDWDDRHYVTGYWYLEASDSWTVPTDLADFLNAGEPPIYIGFGSMNSRNPEEAGAIALEALALSGKRGIIARGWGGLTAGDISDTVHMISSIPHRWLFPQMAAVVHHGGAGTTAAGLGAGVPSIIVPFMGDQPFWGKRVAAMGVGTKPIPRKKLTAKRLADAIKQATSDDSILQKARVLGHKIRSENGVANAVATIEKLTEPYRKDKAITL